MDKSSCCVSLSLRAQSCLLQTCIPVAISGSGFELVPKMTCNTIRYDSVYLTCSKKLMDSHGISKKKLKCETKNKLMSVMVQLLIMKAVQ